MLLTHVLPMQLDCPPDQSPPCNITYVPSQYTLHTWYPVCNNTQFTMDQYGTSPSHAVIFLISWHCPPLSPTRHLSSLTIARTPITSATHPNWKHNLRPPYTHQPLHANTAPCLPATVVPMFVIVSTQSHP